MSPPIEHRQDAASSPDPLLLREPSVVLVGSSILAQWIEADTHLAPLPVANRAVGGTLTGDQLERFDATFEPVIPAIVVYYCGSNDLKAGHDPDAVFANFAAFDARLRAAFPATPLVFVSSMKSPDRRAWWDRVDRYNTLVRSHLAAGPDRHYFDLHPAVHDAAGEAMVELFQPDQIHLLPGAYIRIGGLLRPYLVNLLHPAVPTPASTCSAGPVP